MNLSVEERIKTRFNRELKDVLAEKIDSGLSRYSIAHAIDVSPASLQIYAKKYGLKFKGKKMNISLLFRKTHQEIFYG